MHANTNCSVTKTSATEGLVVLYKHFHVLCTQQRCETSVKGYFQAPHTPQEPFVCLAVTFSSALVNCWVCCAGSLHHWSVFVTAPLFRDKLLIPKLLVWCLLPHPEPVTQWGHSYSLKTSKAFNWNYCCWFLGPNWVRKYKSTKLQRPTTETLGQLSFW